MLPQRSRNRSKRYGRRLNRTHSSALANMTPWASIMLASIIPGLFVISGLPITPPFGFLMLLAWRFVRPGLLPVWAGFPLGLFDDLFSGQPFGSAVLLWSLALLVIEIIESRLPWHGYFQDWLLGTGLVAAYLVLGAILSGAKISPEMLLGIAPQLLLSALVFPIIARMVSWLDRMRLIKFRVVN
ncbi:MAG: rod shape-determining protein MreD [Sphingomonadaceae bacterium]